MKLFKRHCSVLLLFVCLFVLSSPLSYATSSDKTIADRLEDLREESSESSLAPIVENLPVEDSVSVFSIEPEDISNGNIHLEWRLKSGNALGINTDSVSGASNYANYGVSLRTAYSTPVSDTISFSKNDGLELLSEGSSATCRISGLSYIMGTTTSYSTKYYPDFSQGIISSSVTLIDALGESVTLDYDFAANVSMPEDGYVTLLLNLDSVPFDVYEVQIYVEYYWGPLFGFPESTNTMSRYRQYGFFDSFFSWEEEDISIGLLSTIIEWLRSIRDGVSGVVSAIISLPAQIWDFIESGLKALFIPDQEQMIDFNNAMDELLSDRLGALYQGTDMVIDFLMSLGTYERQPTIRFPGLDMSDFGIPFVMEPQDVQIIPDSFDFIVDSIKFIVNVLATILFINSLKRRLEKVFEGE